jgi:hypothetical protein
VAHDASTKGAGVKNAVALISNGIAPGTNLQDLPQIEVYSAKEQQIATHAGKVSLARSKANATVLVSLHPRRHYDDAPYSVRLSDLERALIIPYSFTFGDKPPVIFVPGTGSTGFLTFRGNYLKQFADVSFADPVWLDIPHFLLDDAQVNAVSESCTQDSLDEELTLLAGIRGLCHLFHLRNYGQTGICCSLVARQSGHSMGVQVLAIDPKACQRLHRDQSRLPRYDKRGPVH